MTWTHVILSYSYVKWTKKKTQHTVLRNLLHLDSTFHSTCYLVPIKYEALYQLVLSFPKTEKISTNKFSNKFLLPRVRTDIFFIIVITFSELKTAAEGKSWTSSEYLEFELTVVCRSVVPVKLQRSSFKVDSIQTATESCSTIPVELCASFFNYRLHVGRFYFGRHVCDCFS